MIAPCRTYFEIIAIHSDDAVTDLKAKEDNLTLLKIATNMTRSWNVN
jgi:hypothetical protein